VVVENEIEFELHGKQLLSGADALSHCRARPDAAEQTSGNGEGSLGERNIQGAKSEGRKFDDSVVLHNVESDSQDMSKIFKMTTSIRRCDGPGRVGKRWRVELTVAKIFRVRE